jgi:hypothetical protein
MTRRNCFWSSSECVGRSPSLGLQVHSVRAYVSSFAPPVDRCQLIHAESGVCGGDGEGFAGTAYRLSGVSSRDRPRRWSRASNA